MKLTINEGLKRYFVETNAYNFVAFVDDDGNAYPVFTFDDKSGKEWDELNMTLMAAKNGDYSGVEDCEDAYDVCSWAGGNPNDVFDFDEITEDEYDMYNKPDGCKITEF